MVRWAAQNLRREFEVPVSEMFFFIVIASPQDWPYFAEIPYATWPRAELNNDTIGDCKRPYDRGWSFLSAINRTSGEDVVVWKCKRLRAEIRQGLEELIAHYGDDPYSPAPLARLWLYVLDNTPARHWGVGDAVVASARCDDPRSSAAATRFLMRSLQSDSVWDGQSSSLLTLQQLEEQYLGQSDLEQSDALAFEISSLFAKGEAWHRAHPERRIGWWKTIDEMRELLKREEQM